MSRVQCKSGRSQKTFKKLVSAFSNEQNTRNVIVEPFGKAEGVARRVRAALENGLTAQLWAAQSVSPACLEGTEETRTYSQL